MFYSFVLRCQLTGLDGKMILGRNFQCNGDETHLTDCVVSRIIDDKICGNKRVGLMCETGN